jgi:hypothetical protein
MLNGLDLLVFRLKAKELIYTVLYKCRLLEYTILTPPETHHRRRGDRLAPTVSMVIYPQNHV